MAEIKVGTKLYKRSRKRNSRLFDYEVFEIVRETAAYFFLNDGQKLRKGKSLSFWGYDIFNEAAAEKKKESDFENEAFCRLGNFAYYFNRGDIPTEKVIAIYEKTKDLL